MARFEPDHVIFQKGYTKATARNQAKVPNPDNFYYGIPLGGVNSRMANVIKPSKMQKALESVDYHNIKVNRAYQRYKEELNKAVEKVLLEQSHAQMNTGQRYSWLYPDPAEVVA